MFYICKSHGVSIQRNSKLLDFKRQKRHLTKVKSIFYFQLAVRGLRKRSLSRSGAFLALWVGFILTLAHFSIMLGLITFFLTSSKATRFRQHMKRKIEGEAFRSGKI